MPTPVFLRGKSNGQRSLADYSPQGHTESGTTEHLSTAQHRAEIKSGFKNVRIQTRKEQRVFCIFIFSTKMHSKKLYCEPVYTYKTERRVKIILPSSTCSVLYLSSKKYLFRLCKVLVEALRILVVAWGFWFPDRGSNLGPPALEPWSLSQWTAREVPRVLCFYFSLS